MMRSIRVPISQPAAEPWGLTEMRVQDPGGIRIVLVQVPADHPLRRDPRPRYRQDGEPYAASQRAPAKRAIQRPPGMAANVAAAGGQAQRRHAGRRQNRPFHDTRTGESGLPDKDPAAAAVRQTTMVLHPAAFGGCIVACLLTATACGSGALSPRRPRCLRLPRGPAARAGQPSRCPWSQTGQASRRRPRPLPGSPGTATWLASLTGAGERPAVMAVARQSDLARSRSTSSRDPTGHCRSTAAAGVPDVCRTPAGRRTTARLHLRPALGRRQKRMFTRAWRYIKMRLGSSCRAATGTVVQPETEEVLITAHRPA